jgi:hypothetical protein
MFLGHVFEGGGCGIGPWQKLVEAVLGWPLTIFVMMSAR